MNNISSFSKDEIQKIVQQKIKNNTKFLDEINQYLHNKGIEIVKRYEIVTDVLLNKDLRLDEHYRTYDMFQAKY